MPVRGNAPTRRNARADRVSWRFLREESFMASPVFILSIPFILPKISALIFISMAAFLSAFIRVIRG
jgi:hypothetical protein